MDEKDRYEFYIQNVPLLKSADIFCLDEISGYRLIWFIEYGKNNLQETIVLFAEALKEEIKKTVVIIRLQYIKLWKKMI